MTFPRSQLGGRRAQFNPSLWPHRWCSTPICPLLHSNKYGLCCFVRFYIRVELRTPLLLLIKTYLKLKWKV